MLAEAENPRRLPESRVQAQRFLEKYEEHGRDYVSFTQFCDAFGFSYGYFRKLRSRDPVFKAAIDKLESRPPSTSPAKTRAPAQARTRWPNLTLWKGIFVERYRETFDRIEAANLVDRPWAEIKVELAEDVGFMAAFQTVEDEITVRSEDAMKRQAMKGSGLTSQYLGAVDSPLGRKARRPTKDESDEAKREEFRRLFAARQAQSAPDATPGDEDSPDESEDGSTPDVLDDTGAFQRELAEIDSIGNDEGSADGLSATETA